MDFAIARHYLPDGCPNCGHITKPYLWDEVDGAVRAEHRCDDCGEEWFTSWDPVYWVRDGLVTTPDVA